MRLNLSQLLEQALEEALRERESADWLEQSAGAIDAYNAPVGARGTFSDDWRRF
jgi:post-segregation antitoxin (ccd killing protein)